jgi:hypothetical protein
MALLSRVTASSTTMNVVGGRTIERKIRINDPDGWNARCRASRAGD